MFSIFIFVRFRQTLKIKQLHIHPLYKRDNIARNDLALLELWPKKSDGTCIQFNVRF